MLLKAGMKLPDGTILQYTKKGFGPESTVGRLEISDGGTRWFVAPNNGAWRIRPNSQHDWDKYELGSEGDYTLAKMHENKNKSALDLLKEYRSIVEDDDSKNCKLCGERVADPYKHHCDLNAGSTKRAADHYAAKKKVKESANDRLDLDDFMTKRGFVKVEDARDYASITYKNSVLNLVVMIDHSDSFWTIEDVAHDEVLEDGVGEEDLKQNIARMIRDVNGLQESTGNIVKGSWIPRHDEGQLTWKDRNGIYLVLPGSNSAYGSNDGGFNSVEDAEEFNQQKLGGKWKVQVNGPVPQHNKFNTCSECDGKGCPECEFTGRYDVGVNSDHYL